MKRFVLQFSLAILIAVTLAACGTSPVPGAPVEDTEIQLEGLSLNSASAKLAPRTKIASDALQESIEKFSKGELIVKPSPAPKGGGELSTMMLPQNLEVGDILISEPIPEAPEGLFVRITDVQQSGGIVDYDVTQASFEEAFETLDLDMTKALSSSEITSSVGPQGLGGSSELNTQAIGFTIDSTFANYVICDDDGNTATTNDQIKINGTFKANVSTFAKIKLGFFKLSLFEAGAKLDEQLNLTAKGKCSKSYAKEWLIAQYNFKTFTVWVGPAPIVMTPNVKLYVGSNGQITATVDITATQGLNGRYGVRYSGGWSAIKEGTLTRNVSINTLQGGAQARAFIGPKAGVRFYGAANAWAYPKGFVDTKATVSAPPNPLVDYCINAGINLSVGADLSLNILIKKLNYSWSKNLGDVLTYQILCNKIPYTGGGTTQPPVTTGKLTLSVAPSYVTADLTVSGNGKTHYATNGSVLNLAPGSYTVSGYGYDSSGNTYTAQQTTVSVTSGGSKTLSVYMQADSGTCGVGSGDLIPIPCEVQNQ